MTCPNCNSWLTPVHRRGWPTVKECYNLSCKWVDPIKWTPAFKDLMRKEDLKMLKDKGEQEKQELQDLINFVMNKE